MIVYKVQTERNFIGRRIAFPWGIAWTRPDMREVVLIWIPFNFVVAWAREAWYRLLQGPRTAWEERIIDQLERDYQTGYSQGWQDGEEQGWRSVERNVKLLTEYSGQDIPIMRSSDIQ